MGCGYGFECQKCHYEYDVRTGTGMFFSYTYNKIVSEIKNGIYGNDWKNILLSRDDIIVNITRYLYICPCGNWSVEPALSLYIPKDFYKPTGKYVTEYELKNNYNCKMRYIHKCKKCNSEMTETTATISMHLPCPECNTLNPASSFINWD